MALLVPGGFDHRGINGKIEAIRFAREREIPFFGICLGLQCAAIEFARNVLGLPDANSTEIDRDYAASGRLSARRAMRTSRTWAARCGWAAIRARLKEGSRATQAYGPLIHERHRHRYEFNNRLSRAVRSKAACWSPAPAPTAIWWK